MFRELFDSETKHNLAIILVHVRKKIVSSCSPELMKATLVMVKDVAALYAASIVSGIDIEEWDTHAKMRALWDKAGVSAEKFQNAFDKQFPMSK